MVGKRGQASFEYISVVAVALILIIPSTILFMNYTQNTGDEVLSNQLDYIGNTVMSEAEEMYVLGTDSWSTVNVNLPNSFQNAEIYNEQDLVFNYQSRRGPSQAVFFATRFNMTEKGEDCTSSCELNVSRGSNELRIRSEGDTVTFETIN